MTPVPGPSEEELSELLRLNQEAASALIGGEVERYFELVDEADDYTLMPPFGGVRYRQELTPERIAESKAFFRSGEATVELVESYSSGDLVVLVAIERQHGRIADIPEQDLSLRVTLVFRREHATVGSRWRLVHRHADTLVLEIGLDQVSALARGEVSG